ncbi:phospholipid carrier-dependent glycosyltransferase [Candidatus Curtissbacteria bacterium]|nr:phospholipid carrier-dependent glycosyltransferase [Candidatus Curtissbacteria bacterium]
MNRIIFVLLIFLTVFSLAIRLFRLTEPSHYYFDEVYHAVTAKAYADNNPAPYDPFSPAPKEGTAYDWLHPPLAKLIQAGSIKIFGDVPFGWRLPSAIFGTGIIGATFVLANLLFGPVVAIFAATVIAFENLTFVMSRITMNDVFVTFFVLMSFIFAALYVRSTSEESFSHLGGVKKRSVLLFLTSLFLGFSIATKWTGFWAILALFIYIFWDDFKQKLVSPKILSLFIIPGVIYLLSYSQFWLQGYTFKQFYNLHQQIWWYQSRGDLEHSYATTPIFCAPKGLSGPKTFCPWALDIRPVYFSYEQYGSPRSPRGEAGEKAGYIYALGNPLIFWAGLVAISYIVGRLIAEREKKYLLILLGYFIFWLPFVFTPRILFLHHYLPSLPFLAIALGVALFQIYKSRAKYLVLIFLILVAVVFFYFYPISSGWPIEVAAIDKYMWLPTWR